MQRDNNARYNRVLIESGLIFVAYTYCTIVTGYASLIMREDKWICVLCMGMSFTCAGVLCVRAYHVMHYAEYAGGELVEVPRCEGADDV